MATTSPAVLARSLTVPSVYTRPSRRVRERSSRGVGPAPTRVGAPSAGGDGVGAPLPSVRAEGGGVCDSSVVVAVPVV